MIRLNTPLKDIDIRKLRAGQEVFLTGTIYAARDQAHKRMAEALKTGKTLPLDLRGSVIYYCGPTPAPKGKIIGSCGPTTSSRMDSFTPALLAKGLKAMIGKGSRSPQVNAAIKKFGGVYFITYAGCGALLNKYVRSSCLVAYPELGPEALRRLEVKDLPLFVATDAYGGDIFK